MSGVLPFGAYGYAISVLVISIMISASGIVLGVGFATDNKRLKEFGKSELMQSAVNGMLVGSLLVLFAGGGVIATLINSTALQKNTSINCMGVLSGNAAMCLAYDYLVGSSPYTFMGHSNTSIFDLCVALLLPLYALYAVLGAFGTFLAPLLNQIKYLTQILSATAISATVQAAFLLFSAATSLTLIMPLGIVLRSFYPSRKLGGFLIAVAIGLYAIFPLTYVMDAYAANSFTGSVLSSASSISSLSSSMQQSPANETAANGILSGAYAIVKPIINEIASVVNSLMSVVAYAIIYAFVLPAFSVVVTIVGIKELAQLLGSDASILNRLSMV
ncbi:MAG: hypothetical protein ACP5T3_01100 [Candidatus Micrarchaeia archaeon]